MIPKGNGTTGNGTAWPGAFVVGTGRCGSTLLSRALALHPEVLSLSEFFSGLDFAAFPAEIGIMTGKEFWHLLSATEGLANKLLSVGAEPAEFLYPVDSGRRFDRASGVPRVCVFTLPALPGDPDELYDRLEQAVPLFGEQTIIEHYRELFALLGDMLNRPRWIERSGASGFYAGHYLTHFPSARYVHLTRELEPTARSMRRHPAFRLLALWQEFIDRCGCDVYQGEVPEHPVPADLADLTPERLSKESFERWDPGIEPFRQLVSIQLDLVRATLAPLPARQVLVLGYEELIAHPVAEFSKMAEFLELADPPGWAKQAAALVRH